MLSLPIKTLKNKEALIAEVAHAKWQALRLMKTIKATINKLDDLNVALLFEDMDDIKSVTCQLRDRSVASIDLAGSVEMNHEEVFLAFLYKLHEALNKCRKAKQH